MRSGESRTFILVAEDVFGVLQSLLDLIEVELDDEGSRQVETQRLVIGSRELSDSLDGLKVGVDEEASCVKIFCTVQLSLSK